MKGTQISLPLSTGADAEGAGRDATAGRGDLTLRPQPLPKLHPVKEPTNLGTSWDPGKRALADGWERGTEEVGGDAEGRLSVLRTSGDVLLTICSLR